MDGKIFGLFEMQVECMTNEIDENRNASQKADLTGGKRIVQTTVTNCYNEHTF